MHPNEIIDVFWFKRDLRLVDNDALNEAITSKNKLLPVYLYEPSIWQDAHYDERHYRFIFESIQDLDNDLLYETKILAVQSEVIPFFKTLSDLYQIENIFSTEETGLDITYRRDIEFQDFCFTNGIRWSQFQNNGVVRGLTDRSSWRKDWYNYMNLPQKDFETKHTNFIGHKTISDLYVRFDALQEPSKRSKFQKGGRKEALRWQSSFFEERIAFYSDYISKPELSRYGCSRLSPYFAWGNLSIREVYQKAVELKKISSYKKQLNAFMSRLRWQSHFIQKFEMEPRIEFEAFNKAFLSLEQPINDSYINAWTEGGTGYPLVDAAIRCVVQTGYINFRMRAMIVSFLTHHLFQHFTTVGPWLARQFLDFEPGIHYGQMQMQAGFTGINTVRVYNPTKNAMDHDSDAIFIKKYVPELSGLPTGLAIEPWKVTAMDSEMYGFNYGVDYPERIVNISDTRRMALQKLYGQRKSEFAQLERQRILETHTIPRN
ncbi:Deoxyribodipyrimidine photo-lyase [Flagellimonas maritima]|uniref:Deoxyribodipyrimidine photo-lyase n=1 Tax=Flagellimonas maritima TaxID=1383885 RepID=A0A2Z4LNF0_9FLAO|nr:FAD-binding domain-containing protein [Allomuricauda aurantiaca]AWX43259.1 Deoxyribodipyrimidine photo-lyase [Allomuricauda aurantiaca]